MSSKWVVAVVIVLAVLVVGRAVSRERFALRGGDWDRCECPDVPLSAESAGRAVGVPADEMVELKVQRKSADMASLVCNMLGGACGGISYEVDADGHDLQRAVVFVRGDAPRKTDGDPRWRTVQRK